VQSFPQRCYLHCLDIITAVVDTVVIQSVIQLLCDCVKFTRSCYDAQLGKQPR